jgi:tRNA G18 (ribose-2'-O)-methylase SpoU
MFLQLRHKPATQLLRPRELVVACAPMNSAVNLAQIVRMAGCSAVERVVVCGRPQIDRNIAREAVDQVVIEERRTLAPVLERMKREGYQIVALEQATGSECLYDFAFARKSVLVVGNERLGVDEESLVIADRVAEIPVYGLPYSYNAATSAMIALYEYCRQFPEG